MEKLKLNMFRCGMYPSHTSKLNPTKQSWCVKKSGRYTPYLPSTQPITTNLGQLPEAESKFLIFLLMFYIFILEIGAYSKIWSREVISSVPWSSVDFGSILDVSH